MRKLANSAAMLTAHDTSRRPVALSHLHRYRTTLQGCADDAVLQTWGSNAQIAGPLAGLGDFMRNLPVPTRIGANRYQGLMGLGAVNLVGVGASVGAVAGPIGSAVGAVVGVIASLFGGKKSPPPVWLGTIDYQNAASTMQQYDAIAGTIIGSQLTQAQMQAIMQAFCVNLYGANHGNIGCTSVGGVNAIWTSDLAFAAKFFQALQQTPAGGQVRLNDIPSLPGHGKANMNLFYTFTNPGVSADSATLGPLFAQYMYTIETQYTGDQSAALWGLSAPAPQLWTDFIDWYRSQFAQFAPAVPTVAPAPAGPIASPTQTGGTFAATAAPVAALGPAVTPQVTTGAVTPGGASALTAAATSTPQVTATTSTGASVDVTSLLSQLIAQGQSAAQAQQSAYSTLQSAGVSSSQAGEAVQQAAATLPAPAQAAGFSELEIGLLVTVGGGLLLAALTRGGAKSRRRRRPRSNLL